MTKVNNTYLNSNNHKANKKLSLLPRILAGLLVKSGRLQASIEAENAQSRPNTTRLLKLKKLQLAIEKRLFDLTHMMASPVFTARINPAYAPVKKNESYRGMTR